MLCFGPVTTEDVVPSNSYLCLCYCWIKPCLNKGNKRNVKLFLVKFIYLFIYFIYEQWYGVKIHEH